MPIGTSDGLQFETEWDMVINNPAQASDLTDSNYRSSPLGGSGDFTRWPEFKRSENVEDRRRESPASKRSQQQLTEEDFKTLQEENDKLINVKNAIASALGADELDEKINDVIADLIKRIEEGQTASTKN